MQKFKPQFRRHQVIHCQIRENRHPNCATLSRELEVSTKTIQRDIDFLRDEQGAPIAYDRLRGGFYYTEPNFSLPAIRLTESDLFFVCVAERVLGQYRNTPLFESISSVFQKVRDSLPDTTNVNPAWLNERILIFPDPATRLEPAIWDTLAKAIRDNRRIMLTHVSPRKTTNGVPERTVDPYYLVSHKGEWYLSGLCHHRNSIRTFAVSRITKATVLAECFTMPSNMTAERMFGDQFGIIWNDEFQRVKIRFTAEIAPYIRERQWHPTQRIRERRDGGLELEFTTNHINEVKDWVLSWGGGATALAPRALVAKVVCGIKDAAGNYKI